MMKLLLLLCSTSVAAEHATRRIRTILEIPDDPNTSSSMKTTTWDTADKELQDFFTRALHNDWSLSYPPIYDHHHGHHHGHHDHSHGHGHHHGGHDSSYYDDDYPYGSNPYEEGDDQDDGLTTPNEETGEPTDDAVGGNDDAVSGNDDASFGNDDENTITVPTVPSPAGSTTPSPVWVVPLETELPSAVWVNPFETELPSAALLDPFETELPSAELVVPNEAGEEPTDPPVPDTRACSSHTACSGEVGLCCPDFNNVFKACCFGVTYPPLEDPTDAPIPAPTAFPIPAPTAFPTTGIFSDLPSDTPSTTPSSTPSVNTNNDPAVINDVIRAAVIEEKCGMTESERSQLLIASLSPEGNSPAFQAYQWLDFFDEQIVCPQHPTLKQRSTLATIYYSLNGPNWIACSEVNGACDNADRWLSRANECDWFGVACNSNDEVTVLTLKENGLSGNLPEVIFDLTTLTGLSLDHNKEITGSIPPSIGRLTVLEYVEFDDNKMGGTIPQELFSMTSLKAIDFNGNSFEGSIPDQISNLSKLMVLQLEDNNFEGPLPWFGLAMLKDLLVMYLHGNNFEDGSLEPVCNLMESRRNSYAGYLQFMAADCDSISCSCCSQCF